jgi:NADH:ubiquinone oxidoreductase subunit 3 (subunit A)
MASAEIALPIYAIIALFIPALMMLISLLIRRRGKESYVSRLNFESAEESIGKRITIMSEYFPYFSSFLAFEVLTAVVLIWVGIAGSLSGVAGYAVLATMVLGFVFEAFIMLLSRNGKDG